MCVQTRQSRVPRPAFTLIELLIVLAIIAVLIALGAGAYFGVLKSSGNSNAAIVVTNVQKALATQYNTVKKEALNEPLPPPAANTALNNTYNSVLQNLAGRDATRARVIWVKFRLMQAFPMGFAEAFNPSFVDPVTSQTMTLPSLFAKNLTGVNGLNAAQENAVCLLLALQRTPSSGVPTDAVSKMATKQFGSINGLVDPFGQPLAFSRWPTGSVDLNPSQGLNPINLTINAIPVVLQPQTGFKDPEDPLGTLTDPTWVGTAGATAFANSFHPVQASASFKLQPLVISAGPDKILGLEPTTFCPLSPPDASFDNIVAKITP